MTARPLTPQEGASLTLAPIIYRKIMLFVRLGGLAPARPIIYNYIYIYRDSAASTSGGSLTLASIIIQLLQLYMLKSTPIISHSHIRESTTARRGTIMILHLICTPVLYSYTQTFCMTAAVYNHREARRGVYNSELAKFVLA